MGPETIRLDGRTVLIAGAGGEGIGTASAVLAARAGARVIAVDWSEAGVATAERVLAQAGGAAHRVIRADLFDADAVRALVAGIADDPEPLAGVVNVVGGIGGGGHFAPLLDPEAPAIFERVIEANLKASLLVSVEAARAMRARGTPGSIVQIASSTGLVSMAYGAGYGAAKAALLNLMRTMAVEWGPIGIRVNAIAVGMIRTGRSHEVVAEVETAARAVVPLGRVGTSEEIAGPVLFLLSDLASYVSGAVLQADGGSMARAPYNDASNLPAFVNDAGLRRRLLEG